MSDDVARNGTARSRCGRRLASPLFSWSKRQAIREDDKNLTRNRWERPFLHPPHAKNRQNHFPNLMLKFRDSKTSRVKYRSPMKRSTSTFVIALLLLVSLGLSFFSQLRFPNTLLIPIAVVFVFYSARHDIQTVFKGKSRSKPLSREENFLQTFISFVAFILIVTGYRFYPLCGLALLIFLWFYYGRR
ncbi:MAG: hypothetical protein IT327_26495 [Anaerolineae bacterium]|nr:hypothetical protein [Anaerolineae bacterium]